MKQALIIVDIQNDFVEGGSLAVAGGVDMAHRLADRLPEIVADYDMIVTTQDWHIDPGAHFSDQPNYVTSWPRHCVANTDGAEFVPELATALDEIRTVFPQIPFVTIHKGMFEDAYSGFHGETVDTGNDEVAGAKLADVLREAEITDVVIVGIAEDHCVKATALDAVNLAGVHVTVDTRFTVGITKETIAEFRNEIAPAANVEIV